MAHQSGTEHRDPHAELHGYGLIRAGSLSCLTACNKRCFVAARMSESRRPPTTGPVRLPPLNGLLAFEAAARHGSFARAANELRVTRSAVGHQVRRLEQQLGVRLFTRDASALTLSAMGAQYLPAISTAFARLREATDLLRQQHRRILRVSTTLTVATKWLGPRLPAFRVTHPDIEVRVGTTMRLVDFAGEGVDVGIRSGRGRWPGLRADLLPMADAYFPVCSPALRRGAAPLRRPDDLTGHTLLCVDHERTEWRLWLDAAGVAPASAKDLLRRALSFDVAHMALQAAIDGQGVALAYGPYAEADLAAGRLIAPFSLSLPSAAGFDAYIVCAEAMADAPEVVAFRDFLLASRTASPLTAAAGGH
jgi:LysR family glycine cleavage system transcriptional activator